MSRRFIVLTPTYRAAGGVIKLFDYITHARALDFHVVVHCPDPIDPSLPLFQVERFAELVKDPAVEFQQGFQFGLEKRDIVFFSWPGHYRLVAPRITPAHHPAQAIGIIQGVRWANPDWLDGYAVRLLSRPMARIIVTHQIAERINALLDERWPSRVIVEGHDWPYFFKPRTGRFSSPIRVGYATWKSALGDDIAGEFADDSSFEFRAIRSHVGWPELRELYHWSDIFLAFPGPEEGFYLPGLEAMAAGCIVVMPDVGGNREYAQFGVNCIQVDYEDAASYVAAVHMVATSAQDHITEVRAHAHDVLEAHSLDRERADFASFISDLDHLSS